MRDANDNRPVILFVDDSKTARKAAEKILSDKYIVHEASNGKDAWEQLKKNPDYAVVFADIQMPEMNGLQDRKRVVEGKEGADGGWRRRRDNSE